MNIDEKKIALIGLGYVGLPLAVEFGKIRPVLGFDINKKRISELRSGKDVTLEVDRDQLVTAQYLEFSCDPERLSECDVFIVTVPTPVDAVNRPELSPLISASELVGRSLKVGSIVIYESTVYPGCTEEVCVPVLEKMSGLSFNRDFFCGYSPERINPGDKSNTLTNVVKITSGSTPTASMAVDSLYRSIVKAGTYRASCIQVAEAAKVIENGQRDLNIAFVNELSLIFERLGIDTIEVLEAAGSKWNFLPFRPGLVGGHCIGVDPYYLNHKAEEVGYNAQLILAARRLNDGMAAHAARSFIKLMIKNGQDVSRSIVCIFGITFKDNCPDIRNSKVVDLVKELNSWGVNTIIVDPWACPIQVKEEYGIHLHDIDDLNKVDNLIVAVGHDQFKALPMSRMRGLCGTERPVLADLKSIYNKAEAEKCGFTVFRL